MIFIFWTSTAVWWVVPTWPSCELFTFGAQSGTSARCHGSEYRKVLVFCLVWRWSIVIDPEKHAETNHWNLCFWEGHLRLATMSWHPVLQLMWRSCNMHVVTSSESRAPLIADGIADGRAPDADHSATNDNTRHMHLFDHILKNTYIQRCVYS